MNKDTCARKGVVGACGALSLSHGRGIHAANFKTRNAFTQLV